ncbi:DoxX family protein [Polaribacter sargassicola]|uniref:DoxX family protein n=1 Tax=Polaribacter sargassicola TaxID=2836891 RepID=UPI001F1FB839|nr:DoxX family protein [Polaribacter sp. DS7-9]MCG1037001.1 DoxX family protein [Polaribacter sp. DS7-9]
MKTTKIIYYLSTGLLSIIMLFSAGMYLFNNEMVSGFFIDLGYPTYIIYPLAIAKILGLIAIWFIKSKSLKEWAYAGFFFDFVLAFAAHFMVKDGGHLSALVAIVLLLVSYFTHKKIINEQR